MPLRSTYLSWVDFSGTGLDSVAIKAICSQKAMIAANYGPSFGYGGESWMRFNIAMPRIRIEDAIDRLQTAFGG